MAAMNNLSDGHPMKENMDFCKDFDVTTAPMPIFNLSNVTPDNYLQRHLKAFFTDTEVSPLYSTLNGETPIAEQRTPLIRDFDDLGDRSKNLYQVLEASLMHEWTAFFNSSLCKSLFSSVGDRVSAVRQGDIYNTNLIAKIKGILKPESCTAAEAITQLRRFENWRTTRRRNADPNDFSLTSTGGVTTFFENVFDFKSPKPVRNMFEHPDAASQCKQIYGALGYEIVKNSSPPEELGPDPDGLAFGRTPLYWQNTTDESMVAPVTCYICECYLYNTVTGRENNMECEHYFPFLEAQLFWGLHMPNIINDNDERRLKFLKREYGPVCRLCNGATHKTGLAMIKMRDGWGGGATFNPKFELNMFAINRIARNTPGIENLNGRPMSSQDGNVSQVLNQEDRLERLKNVFSPLIQHINYELRKVSARRIVEILMLRYFYHLNDRTLKKIYGAYLNGEDITKKEKERKKFVKMIKKTHRQLRMVEHGVSKGFNKFKKFVLGKKRAYDNIGKSAVDRAKAIFRRSRRTAEIIEEKKRKAREELVQIKKQNSEIAKMMSDIETLKDEFTKKYETIIEDPENHMFETEGEENTYKSDLDSLCEKNNAIVQYFMSNKIQKGGAEKITDLNNILFVNRKYDAYVIMYGFNMPVIRLMGGYLEFLTAFEIYIGECLNFIESIGPAFEGELFKNIYDYEKYIYEHQEIAVQREVDFLNAFENVPILNIFSEDITENPYAAFDVYSTLVKKNKFNFIEKLNKLIKLLSDIDRDFKPFPINSVYSETVDKYCRIKIEELKESIVRGKIFDLKVDYEADNMSSPAEESAAASSGGESKHDGVSSEEIKSFKDALDKMINDYTGNAIPSYLIDRWYMMEVDENIEYLVTVRDYLENIFAEGCSIKLPPELFNEEEQASASAAAEKEEERIYRLVRFEMINDSTNDFEILGDRYKSVFPHIFNENINVQDIDNLRDIDQIPIEGEDEWLRDYAQHEAARQAELKQQKSSSSSSSSLSFPAIVPHGDADDVVDQELSEAAAAAEVAREVDQSSAEFRPVSRPRSLSRSASEVSEVTPSPRPFKSPRFNQDGKGNKKRKKKKTKRKRRRKRKTRHKKKRKRKTRRRKKKRKKTRKKKK